MMEKIFENDAYIKKFESEITEINKENKTVKLENTAFYGRSGGQPGDIGEMELDGKTIIVKDTIKEENSIVHIVEDLKNLENGKKIKGLINWEKRYRHMKMHSALHLLCSIIPLDVTGGQIGFEKSRLDFNDPNKIMNKEEVDEKINNIIKENHKITNELIDSKILDEKPEIVRTMSVKPPRTQGEIRLVKIGNNIDLQPCGGTHVLNTSEIGTVFVSKIENKGRMNRRINIKIND